MAYGQDPNDPLSLDEVLGNVPPRDSDEPFDLGAFASATAEDDPLSASPEMTTEASDALATFYDQRAQGLEPGPLTLPEPPPYEAPVEPVPEHPLVAQPSEVGPRIKPMLPEHELKSRLLTNQEARDEALARGGPLGGMQTLTEEWSPSKGLIEKVPFAGGLIGIGKQLPAWTAAARLYNNEYGGDELTRQKDQEIVNSYLNEAKIAAEQGHTTVGEIIQIASQSVPFAAEVGLGLLATGATGGLAGPLAAGSVSARLATIKGLRSAGTEALQRLAAMGSEEVAKAAISRTSREAIAEDLTRLGAKATEKAVTDKYLVRKEFQKSMTELEQQIAENAPDSLMARTATRAKAALERSIHLDDLGSAMTGDFAGNVVPRTAAGMVHAAQMLAITGAPRIAEETIQRSFPAFEGVGDAEGKNVQAVMQESPYAKLPEAAAKAVANQYIQYATELMGGPIGEAFHGLTSRMMESGVAKAAAKLARTVPGFEPTEAAVTSWVKSPVVAGRIKAATRFMDMAAKNFAVQGMPGEFAEEWAGNIFQSLLNLDDDGKTPWHERVVNNLFMPVTQPKQSAILFAGLGLQPFAAATAGMLFGNASTTTRDHVTRIVNLLSPTGTTHETFVSEDQKNEAASALYDLAKQEKTEGTDRPYWALSKLREQFTSLQNTFRSGSASQWLQNVGGTLGKGQSIFDWIYGDNVPEDLGKKRMGDLLTYVHNRIVVDSTGMPAADKIKLLQEIESSPSMQKGGMGFRGRPSPAGLASLSEPGQAHYFAPMDIFTQKKYDDVKKYLTLAGVAGHGTGQLNSTNVKGISKEIPKGTTDADLAKMFPNMPRAQQQELLSAVRKAHETGHTVYMAPSMSISGLPGEKLQAREIPITRALNLFQEGAKNKEIILSPNARARDVVEETVERALRVTPEGKSGVRMSSEVSPDIPWFHGKLFNLMTLVRGEMFKQLAALRDAPGESAKEDYRLLSEVLDSMILRKGTPVRFYRGKEKKLVTARLGEGEKKYRTRFSQHAFEIMSKMVSHALGYRDASNREASRYGALLDSMRMNREFADAFDTALYGRGDEAGLLDPDFALKMSRLTSTPGVPGSDNIPYEEREAPPEAGPEEAPEKVPEPPAGQVAEPPVQAMNDVLFGLRFSSDKARLSEVWDEDSPLTKANELTTILESWSKEKQAELGRAPTAEELADEALRQVRLKAPDRIDDEVEPYVQPKTQKDRIIYDRVKGMAATDRIKGLIRDALGLADDAEVTKATVQGFQEQFRQRGIKDLGKKNETFVEYIQRSACQSRERFTIRKGG